MDTMLHTIIDSFKNWIPCDWEPAADQLEADLSRCGGELEEKVRYFHETVAADMSRIRELADALETVTAKEYWPYPSYSDILFYM